MCLCVDRMRLLLLLLVIEDATLDDDDDDDENKLTLETSRFGRNKFFLFMLVNGNAEDGTKVNREGSRGYKDDGNSWGV